MAIPKAFGTNCHVLPFRPLIALSSRLHWRSQYGFPTGQQQYQSGGEPT
jgi:hypothetical protein